MTTKTNCGLSCIDAFFVTSVMALVFWHLGWERATNFAFYLMTASAIISLGYGAYTAIRDRNRKGQQTDL